MWDLLSTFATVGIELGLVAALTVSLYALVTWLTRRMSAFRGETEDSSRAFRRRLRSVLIMAALAMTFAVVGYNGWLVFRGEDVTDRTRALLGALSVQIWIEAAVALTKLAAAVLGLLAALRILRIALSRLEAMLNRWDQLRDNDRSLTALLGGVNRSIVVTGWMLLTVFACYLFSAPEVVVGSLLRITRAYVVIAVGLLVVRSSVTIVDTLEGLSQRYAQDRGWLSYYEHLRPLVPTFRACLEYGLWIALASLALLQLDVGTFTQWGPSLIQAIGIFFLSRVVIELGRLEIGRRTLPPHGLDEMTRRRRETIAPLVRSTFTYAVYFATAVLILASLGFNPLPFLAGAGILGLVVGFGAQALINDVVSGFFILFENTYLVGDSIEAAGARGVVEGIEFRTTRIRDPDGRLHIVRNGDVKEVVNYSKDYSLAVVSVDVVYQADLRAVFAVLREAGARLHAESADVVAQTEIDGIVAFGASTMTVRTSTRVRPGRHEVAAAELRLAIKEAFDRLGDGSERRGLVPAGLTIPTPLGPRDHIERIGDEAENRVA